MAELFILFFGVLCGGILGNILGYHQGYKSGTIDERVNMAVIRAEGRKNVSERDTFIHGFHCARCEDKKCPRCVTENHMKYQRHVCEAR